jgi:hypothetical protein
MGDSSIHRLSPDYLLPIPMVSAFPRKKNRHAIKSTGPVFTGAGRSDGFHPLKKRSFKPFGKLFLIPPDHDDDQRNNPGDDGGSYAEHSK